VNGPGRPGKTAAVLVGGAASFVAGVYLLEAIRPALLLDPDPGWLVPRFLLWLTLLSATVAAGVLAAAVFFLWSRSRFCPEQPHRLPFRRRTIVLLAVAALVSGVLVRFAWLDTLPIPLWLDDVTLIEPALALEGKLRDFRNAIRPAPYGVAKPFGSVGVLYLELYRISLELAGTNVLGVRFPSALAGAVSVFTAMLVARALLPQGGGALAGLALAGMRWSLILSRWGWNAIVLAPILDVAALLLIAARRRRSLFLAATAGLVAGLSTHIYLASWVGSAALLLIAAWPTGREEGRPWQPALAFAFAIAFAAAALPIFTLKEGRTSPYFARASDQNVALEIRRSRSPLPLFAASADALAAPWFLSDPTPRHDLPGRSRLGWIGGSFAAVALGFAILRPRRELSAYLLANASAAFAASVVGGRATAPNGYRFGYLANVSAVAIAAGALLVLATAPAARRRLVALALTGAVAIASAAGARDAIVRWAESRTTFDDFWGEDTLVARAAVRWDSFGSVDLDPNLAENPLTVAGVRRYRLDPDRERGAGSRKREWRKFRIAAPDSRPESGERLVERVADPWGREWARVYARKTR
jgi:hypothetical protein